MSYGPDQELRIVKTYRHVGPDKLERIRFSQTKVGDEIRIIDSKPQQPTHDGTYVIKIAGPPRFSVATAQWRLVCADEAVRKPVSASLFEQADKNVSRFVSGPTG